MRDEELIIPQKYVDDTASPDLDGIIWDPDEKFIVETIKKRREKIRQVKRESYHRNKPGPITEEQLTYLHRLAFEDCMMPPDDFKRIFIGTLFSKSSVHDLNTTQAERIIKILEDYYVKWVRGRIPGK